MAWVGYLNMSSLSRLEAIRQKIGLMSAIEWELLQRLAYRRCYVENSADSCCGFLHVFGSSCCWHGEVGGAPKSQYFLEHKWRIDSRETLQIWRLLDQW